MDPSKTIMITEDDVFNREILKDILASQGYHVLTAQSLSEMFSQMNSSKALDLVLLDLHLPDGSGLSAIDGIRRHYEVPILLITAAVTADNEKLAREKGIRKILAKPFTPSELLEEVQNILA